MSPHDEMQQKQEEEALEILSVLNRVRDALGESDERVLASALGFRSANVNEGGETE